MWSCVREASERWPVPTTGGDLNLLDLGWLAGFLEGSLDIRLPFELPSVDDGVEVVESVEREMVAGKSARFCSADELAARVLALSTAIERRGLLSPMDLDTRCVTALYSWHGCLNMVRVVRLSHKGPSGIPIAYATMEDRGRAYGSVLKRARSEASRGNLWVEYGVSLARPLERTRVRGVTLVDGWIPRDSPYWKNENGATG